MFRIFHYKPITVFKVLLFQLRYHKVLTYCVKPIIIKVCKREERERERGQRERELLLVTVYFIQSHVFITNQNIFQVNTFFYYVSLTILHYFSNNAVSKIKFRK